ncbi:MAG TPA: fructosamine kinase family protein [Candidatus Limnocylindrales bacterium]|nr:fructosamine kinase family protein [Candidatus Limnocylindrales bacterium]
MTPAVGHRIEQELSARIRSVRPLAGGCVADVQRLELSDGRSVVAKLAAAPGGSLDLEAWMLRYLAERSSLPVPRVLLGEPSVLVLEYIEHDGRGDAALHAAEVLAALHSIEADSFGLDRDTLIGSLPQPNPRTERWLDFFREHRLMHFGRAAVTKGRLDVDVLHRLERLAARLEQWLPEVSRPSLIHGDVWGGNVLVNDGRVAAFVDPAIYYADAEIELAFTTLFATFSSAFYRRYDELRPIRAGFFEERCPLYNLYPLLVHTILFGGSYARSVESTVRRFVG